MGLRSTLSFSLIFLNLLGLVISNDSCMYIIFVKTGTEAYAGTDSKISMRFFDARGHEIRIDNLQYYGMMGSGHDYFEKGNLDIFKAPGNCLPGPVCKMELTSDNSGWASGWYVDNVEIITTTPQVAACIDGLFTVSRWLESDNLTADVDNCSNKRNNDKLRHPNKTISTHPNKTTSTYPNKTISTHPSKTISP